MTQQPRLIYVTYADGAYEANFAPNAAAARRHMKVDQTILFTRKDLEADPIYAPNRAVFDAARGKGYWAWKPWAILQALHQAQPGDVVIYHDCGFGLRYKTMLRPRKLIALAQQRGFIAGVRTHLYGPNRRWSHRRCIEAIGAYTEQYLNAPTIEAVVSIWVAGPQSIAFVQRWLGYCLQLDVIADPGEAERGAQDPAFFEHRYDQAILTNLSIRDNAPVLEPDPAIEPYAKSITALEVDLRAASNPIFWLIKRLAVLVFDVRRLARLRKGARENTLTWQNATPPFQK